MNHNFNNFNTNIDDYSDSELLNILELDTLDHDTIINKIDYLNNNYFKNNKLLGEFFFSIKDRLLNTNNLILDNNNIDNNEDNNSIDNNSIDNNSIDYNSIDYNEDNNSIDYNSIDNNENNNENIIESFANLDENDITNNGDISSNSEIYFIDNYLHFNTKFRSFNNSNIKTNSSFELSTVINNLQEIRLSSINIKKPYLISNSKSNNKFRIKEYKKNSNIVNNIINISNGYYEDISELEDFLNNNYFYKSSSHTDNSDNFLKSLVFKIDKNTQQSIFDLCENYINNDNNNFNYFELDFNTDYIPYYSLAEILGFEINSSNISNNKLIISNFPINNIGNNELFFCFDENKGNIIETHKLFLNNNMSVFKILAKINTSLGNKNNNYYINETFTKSTRNDNIRKYSGLINLSKFNIKIIDYYNNIINEDINYDFTFSLESRVQEIRLI
jgi:hypothetical protein